MPVHSITVRLSPREAKRSDGHPAYGRTYITGDGLWWKLYPIVQVAAFSLAGIAATLIFKKQTFPKSVAELDRFVTKHSGKRDLESTKTVLGLRGDSTDKNIGRGLKLAYEILTHRWHDVLILAYAVENKGILTRSEICKLIGD